MGKIRSWKRRFWCAKFHVLVRDKLCIYECDPPKFVNGIIVPGQEYSVWSMRCGQCR